MYLIFLSWAFEYELNFCFPKAFGIVSQFRFHSDIYADLDLKTLRT